MLWKTLIAMWETFSQSKLFLTRTLLAFLKLAVAALASVRAGCRAVPRIFCLREQTPQTFTGISRIQTGFLVKHYVRKKELVFLAEATAPLAPRYVRPWNAWSWLLASFRVRDRKYLSVGSPMVPNPWWFFVAGKDSSRLRFGSKYPTLSWIFRKDRLVGVSWRWFPRPRSSSVVVRGFCSLAVRARCCRTVSSSFHWKFVSYRFLALVRPQSCSFSWGLSQML